MPFPETRHSLIQRIVAVGDESDWRQFLDDYWASISRFAARSGGLNHVDAEEVASQVFEGLLANQLLHRWVSNRSAKLRTLLCAVARNVISNRVRVRQGRQRLIKEHLDRGGELPGMDVPTEDIDLFYAAWVESLLEQAIETLLEEYHSSGRGDYFRVLYGRVCEGATMAEVAALLCLSVSSAENYYKAARKRLSDLFAQLLRDHVCRYAPDDAMDAEFAAEWARLGEYLKDHGGLEEAIRRAYGDGNAVNRRQQQSTRISATLSRRFGLPKSTR